MLDKEEIKKITEEFFNKMTIAIGRVDVDLLLEQTAEGRETIDLNIDLDEPQILIGQGGQTLFETQRLLGMVINKKIQAHYPGKICYLNLDINNYKKKKIDYLKVLAKEAADQVVETKQEKILSPMPAYERRIIHAELAQRTDVMTESQGEGLDRHIVIKVKN